MSITDFLFQGSPPPSVTTYGSTTASLPPWFEAYQQALLGRANIVASEQYQPYSAPAQTAYDQLGAARIAPFNQNTQTGWQMGQTAATSYQPSLASATTATQGALSGPTGYQNAQPALSASTNAPTGLQIAQPMLNAGANASSVGAAQPYIGAATTAPSGYSVAQPGLAAGMSADSQAGAQPYYNQGLAAPTGAAVAAPNLNAAAGASSVGAANPMYTGALAAPSGAEVAAPNINAAASASGAAAANPYYAGALSAPSGYEVAQPGIASSNTGWPAASAEYMNPFTDQVANRVAQLSNRNLMENVLPNINDNFVRTGMLGSSRNGEFTSRAVRDQGESLQGALSSLYSGAWNTGAQQYQTDAQRRLQGAATAGGLQNQDVTNQMGVGTNLGNLVNTDAGRDLQAGVAQGQLQNEDITNQLGVGTNLGALTNADANRDATVGATQGTLQNQAISNILGTGTNIGNLMNNDASRQLQGASTAGALQNQNVTNLLTAGNTVGALSSNDANRDISAGQIAGNLQNSNITNLQNAGQIAGSLTNADRTTTGALGQNMANLAGREQSLGITGAAAYEGIGQQQQQQQQQLLDMMYNNFLEQRQYPQTQTAFMNNMIRGLQAPTSTSNTTTAPASNYNAPPFAQLLGTGLTLQSLLGRARGGRVRDPRNYARGGRVVADPVFKRLPRGYLTADAPMKRAAR